jgi:RNA polymerase sigma-70 factor (ECF subfamily)
VDLSASPRPDDENTQLHLAQAGDEVAFGALMTAHYSYVYRLVYGIVRHEHDARDICQEVWLTVWRKLPDYQGVGKFTTWLHPVATRRALDHLRKRRRWYDRFLPFASGSDANHTIDATVGEDGHNDNDRADLRDRLDQALATLPPMQRTVLTLREVQGLSYEEIAKAAGIPAGTVMSRLYHARRLLAKKLKENP